MAHPRIDAAQVLDLRATHTRDQIATIMQCSRGSVDYILNRALKTDANISRQTTPSIRTPELTIRCAAWRKEGKSLDVMVAILKKEGITMSRTSITKMIGKVRREVDAKPKPITRENARPLAPGAAWHIISSEPVPEWLR
jgi:hypothetical protein